MPIPRAFPRLAVLAGFLASSTQAIAQGRAFTPNDWYRLTTVSAPAVSPDGNRIAFTVTTVIAADNKRHSEVWMVPASGGEPMRLTSPGVESSNPRWSPDGKLLLFTSNRPGAKGGSGNRTWALRMDQPGGEAFEVDSLPPGSRPRDGRFLAWAEGDTARPQRDTTRRDPFARMQPMARPPFGAITSPLDPARFDGRHIVEVPYKSNGPGFLPNPREARTYRAAQIWVRPLDGGPKQAITRTAYSHQNVRVSPDGQWIAFTADPRLRPDSAVRAERDSLSRLRYDARRDEAPRNDADIFVMPAAGGEPRRITHGPGNEGPLAWSPDSKRIAYVAAPARTASRRIYVVDLAGGAPVNLLGDWQYEPNEFTWLADGRISFAAAIGGRTALFALDPATRQRTELLAGRRRISGLDWDDGGKTVAYVATSLTRPTELFVAASDGTGERQLTRFNDAVSTEIAWSDAERFTFRSVGGLEIEGWLMKPFGYTAGQKYPLVLYIHGGRTFDILALTVQDLPFGVQSWLFFAFLIAFAVKVPMVPVHTWLPDAHVQAPTAGSIILAGVLLKMGAYGFLRFSLPMLPEASAYYAPLMMVLSVVAIVYGGLLALAQDDLKKLVAYSSISHMGFVTLGIFALNERGVEGAILQMFNHGIITGALFLFVGLIYERTHTRSIADYGGLMKAAPVYTAFLALFTLASMALPGTSGFVGELLVLTGAFGANLAIGAAAVPGALLAAAYLLGMYRRVALGPAEVGARYHIWDVDGRELAAILPLALFVLWVGLYPMPFLDIIHASTANLLEQVHGAPPGAAGP